MSTIRGTLVIGDADYRITNTEPRAIARESIILTALSSIIGFAVLVSVGVSPVGCFVLGIAAGIGGFVLPIHRVRQRAENLRGELDLAVSVLLDRMNIQMAGGAGIETALLSAASLGDGWCFRRIRQALAGAQASRRSYWDALVELGQTIGCQSLVEIAHSARMAGEHGARIRQTLTSKSTSLRARNLARIEYQAQQRTEQMGLPMVVLFVSFLIFVGYPAMAQTMTAV